MPSRTSKNDQNKLTKEDNTSINKEIKVIIDKTNLKIIKELIDNPNIKSSELAYKLQIPLSTIQRRRTALEKTSILRKEYTLDLRKCGLRIVEILVGIKKGEINQVMDDIRKKHHKNIIAISNKIGDPIIGYGIKIVFSNSDQLFNILEEIKRNPIVVEVKWYETVLEEKNHNISITEILTE